MSGLSGVSGRWLGAVAAAVYAVLNAGACGQSEAGKSAPLSVKEVRLGYFANLTHAQAVLGVDSGDFQRALGETKLSTRTFNAGPSLVESIFAGEIDIGYVGPSPALNAHLQSRGRGIRVIAGAAANGVVIVAAPGSGIKKLEDLKGKRIASPQLGNTQDVSARHFLISPPPRGLGQTNADSVIPIANAEQVSMMSRREIDAAWAVEPWGARLVSEAGGKIIAEEKDLWPDRRFVLTLVVVSPEFLRDHADVVERLLAVHREWTNKLSKDAPSYAPECAAAIERLTGKRMGVDIIGTGLGRVVFTDDPMPESMETFARWAFDLGLSKGVPKVSSLVDTTILERLRAAERASNVPPAPVPAR